MIDTLFFILGLGVGVGLFYLLGYLDKKAFQYYMDLGVPKKKEEPRSPYSE